jgi:hypothetical protein
MSDPFDLEASIAEWRQRMLASGITTPVPLEELESHLRDDIEAQMEAGTDAPRAFASATTRIGPAMELRGEFQKANRIETMKRHIRETLLAIALIATLVGFLLPPIAKWKAHQPWNNVDIAGFAFGVILFLAGAAFTAVCALRRPKMRPKA